MKSNKNLVVVLAVTLFVLTACKPTEVEMTDEPQIANPASVYCEQNGHRLEIQTAADGSQSGVCIFADGSTCDEWAYFRGECGMAAQNTLETESTTEATKDASGGGPGGGDNSAVNASGGFMESGISEAFSDWWGVIKSTESGAQYDDYFERQDLGLEYINFGIDATSDELKAQIMALRDSGKIVHLSGTLFSNVPDYNGSQVLVDDIVVED